MRDILALHVDLVCQHDSGHACADGNDFDMAVVGFVESNLRDPVGWIRTNPFLCTACLFGHHFELLFSWFLFETERKADSG